jgi:alkanesulfonate monooxygenase SsuD/methylene tetrahydromethanopterin reductase-like flavin-dependent oxidoreductase (luciferase family)
MVNEAMIDGLTLAGSPKRCHEKLADLVDAGVTTAIFAVAGGPDFAKNLESLYRKLIRDFI